GLAALAAEQAGVGLLIFTDHGETNHGDQDGDRRQNDTIHLKLLPRESGKKIRATRDRRNCSPLCRLDGRSRLGKRVNLVLLIAFVRRSKTLELAGPKI